MSDQPSAMREKAEQLAQQFHEAYERLAPMFSYSEVPQNNRELMMAVCTEILAGWQAAQLSEAEPAQRTPDGYAYRYPDGIRFGTKGRAINGSDPLEIIPFYYAPLRTGLSEAKIKEVARMMVEYVFVNWHDRSEAERGVAALLRGRLGRE